MSVKCIVVPAGGGLDRLQVSSRPAQSPGPGEITVRLRASSLNYHDYVIVSGLAPRREDRIPMSDGAGEVVAVGEGVSEFAQGDHVVSTFFPDWLDGDATVPGFGRVPGDGIDGYAREFVTMPATAFTRIPQGYSFAEAATLTTAGLTAWRALFVNDSIKPGDTVLTQGSGGVSLFVLQFAKLAGARVIVTSSSDEKLERLKELGADEVINYRSDPEWGRTARQLTDNVGVDHVIDLGGNDTLEQSVNAVKVGGYVSLIGVLGGITPTLPLAVALSRHVRLHAFLVGSRQHQIDMIRAIEHAKLRPIIDRHFALDELADAFRYQESGKHFGKIVVDI